MRGVVSVLAVAVLVAAAPLVAQPNTLSGSAGGPHPPLVLSPQGTEVLFRGDLVPEIGIGCSNGTGNSGGPNDVAVQVTASLVPPLDIISTTYNVFTNLGFVVTHSFVAWAGGAVPGLEIGRQPTPPGPGNVTAAITPAIQVTSASFHFGFNQPQTAAGMRWGLDTSGGGTADSFIRASACGLSSWGTLTSIGLPGNWVMAAVVDETIPVELTAFDVE